MASLASSVSQLTISAFTVGLLVVGRRRIGGRCLGHTVQSAIMSMNDRPGRSGAQQEAAAQEPIDDVAASPNVCRIRSKVFAGPGVPGS
jgi:hypothetical protein